MVVLTVKVTPSAMVNVALVAGAVMATLLTLVTEATPRVGVTNVGLVEKTRLVDVVPVAPEAVYPVMLLNAVMLAEEAFVPPLATGSTPVTPEVRTKPPQLVRVPEEGVPKTGVVKVGEVKVLLVNVSVPAKVAKVPVVGKVTPVVPVAVNVTA